MDTQISVNKALDIIGKDIFWKIPNDYATMVESRNNGVPLILQSPKAKLTRSYIDLAQEFMANKLPKESEPESKKSLFSFLGR